jgi:hypothetical protein
MSRVLDFLRSITPTFTKDEVKEKLRLIAQALQKTVQVYLSAADAFNSGYKSKAGQDFESSFKRQVRTNYRGNPIQVIQQVLQNISSLGDLLSGLVEKNYNKDVTVEGLTYKRAEILRTLGFMDFTTTYARQLLHYLLASQANVQAKTAPAGQEIPKPEIEWLSQNQQAFFTLLITFALPANEILKKIDAIPDIGVGDNDEVTIHPTVGIGRLDPLKNNFIPHITPMFMNIGIWWAQRQTARYERMVEDVRVIEYRIEQLRLQAAGKEDAQLERSIAKYEEYLADLAEKIAKAEKKWK